LVPLVLLVFVAADAFRAWYRARGLGAALRAWLVEWSPPVAVLGAVTLAIMGANYARYGVFAVTDLATPGYTAAFRALLSIEPKQPMRYAPVTREARELAYAVSPSFRELAPWLEDRAGDDWAETEGQYHLPPREIPAGLFCWVLRDAVAVAGYYQSAGEAEAYYHRVANEIRAAAAHGRIPTRWVPTISLDPALELYPPWLVASWCELWSICWYGDDYKDLVEDNATGEHLTTFDLVACRRSIARGAPLQSEVRSWLWAVYSAIMEIALAAAGLVAATVLILGRGLPGKGLYLLTGAALAVAGLSRVAMLSLVNISMYPVTGLDFERYLFPAAVTLTVMTAWLLAEGLRLLGGKLVPWYRRRRTDALALQGGASS
jgi:hypothetical protein